MATDFPNSSDLSVYLTIAPSRLDMLYQEIG